MANENQVTCEWQILVVDSSQNKTNKACGSVRNLFAVTVRNCFEGTTVVNVCRDHLPECIKHFDYERVEPLTPERVLHVQIQVPVKYALNRTLGDLKYSKYFAREMVLPKPLSYSISKAVNLDEGDVGVEGFVKKSHKAPDGVRVIDEFELTGVSVTESGLKKMLDSGAINNDLSGPGLRKRS